jgi:hypothetical protein
MARSLAATLFGCKQQHRKQQPAAARPAWPADSRNRPAAEASSGATEGSQSSASERNRERGDRRPTAPRSVLNRVAAAADPERMNAPEAPGSVQSGRSVRAQLSPGAGFQASPGGEHLGRGRRWRGGPRTAGLRCASGWVLVAVDLRAQCRSLRAGIGRAAAVRPRVRRPRRAPARPRRRAPRAAGSLPCWPRKRM